MKRATVFNKKDLYLIDIYETGRSFFDWRKALVEEVALDEGTNGYFVDFKGTLDPYTDFAGYGPDEVDVDTEYAHAGMHVLIQATDYGYFCNVAESLGCPARKSSFEPKAGQYGDKVELLETADNYWIWYEKD